MSQQEEGAPQVHKDQESDVSANTASNADSEQVSLQVFTVPASALALGMAELAPRATC